MKLYTKYWRWVDDIVDMVNACPPYHPAHMEQAEAIIECISTLVVPK